VLPTMTARPKPTPRMRMRPVDEGDVVVRVRILSGYLTARGEVRRRTETGEAPR
jgi:hypothetical protein